MATETRDFSAQQERLRRGEIRLPELVEQYLNRIEANRHLNAFLQVYADEALRQAEQVQSKIQAGEGGALAGLIVAVKDNIAIRHKALTCGSRMLENFISPYDATVVGKLRAADAIIIGKTNMDEFAMGSSNENSAFGAVANPYDHSRVPGGSSGGSAAAVAAGMCMAALGSDTGGSIRQPAAFCGLVGLKPTYGRVSRFGLVAFASSLDQIGPITRSVEDAARLLHTISGHDERDSTSAPEPVPDYGASLEHLPPGLRIGVAAEFLQEGVQPEIAAAVERAKQAFQDAGMPVQEIHLKLADYHVAAYYVICTAEASSNLARYDGVRYGFRAENAADLEEMYVKTRTQGFGKEVKRRIMLGTYVLSAGYYDAYYRRAMKVRTLIRREFMQAFEHCDLILAPTTPTTAFRLGERLQDPLTMYLSDVFTVSANLSGLPAVSVPAGRDPSGLPIGIQLMARPFDESTLLQTARFLEKTFEE